MILFSNFNHITILCLFVYMGLISGLFYKLVVNFKNILIKKIKKALKGPLNEKTTKKQINLQQQPQQQKTTPKEQEKTLSKNKFKNSFKNFLILTKNILLKIAMFFIKLFPHIAIILCISISYFINYTLNFGYLRVIYVLIWLCSFFSAKSLYNLVANYFFAFYNWVIKRKNKKCQNQTIIIKEKQN